MCFCHCHLMKGFLPLTLVKVIPLSITLSITLYLSLSLSLSLSTSLYHSLPLSITLSITLYLSLSLSTSSSLQCLSTSLPLSNSLTESTHILFLPPGHPA